MEYRKYRYDDDGGPLQKRKRRYGPAKGYTSRWSSWNHVPRSLDGSVPAYTYDYSGWSHFRVQERIHSRYQQTTLMHRHRKRPGEYSASLPILESAVAEQQGIMGREVMRHLASLSDKATDNLSGICDLAPEETMKSCAITLSPINTGALSYYLRNHFPDVRYSLWSRNHQSSRYGSYRY